MPADIFSCEGSQQAVAAGYKLAESTMSSMVRAVSKALHKESLKCTYFRAFSFTFLFCTNGFLYFEGLFYLLRISEY